MLTKTKAYNNGMIILVVIILFCFMLINSCRIFESSDNGGNGGEVTYASLLVENNNNEEVNVKFSYQEYIYEQLTLVAGERFTLNVPYSDPVFDDDGVIEIEYWNYNEEDVAYFPLSIEATGYFELNFDKAALIIFNNKSDYIRVELDDDPEEDAEEFIISSEEYEIIYWHYTNSFFYENYGVVNLVFYNNDIGFYEEETLTIEAGKTTYKEIDESDYRLKIYNETNALIWYQIDGGEEKYVESQALEIESWNSNESILNKTLAYSGYHVFSETEQLTIVENIVERFHIYADGGAIEIINNAIDEDIIAVYVSPSSDSLWGGNDLTGSIETDQAVTWTVTEGYWDLMVENENSQTYTIYESYISLDETIKFDYPEDFIETKSSFPDKRLSDRKKFSVIKYYKVEQN